jgi:4-diphosphocytidyl-2-C-methyl-D-erythritol kinase
MNDEQKMEEAGKGLLVRAPGKINLSLLIAGKRPDGYHDIETIMAKISLYDEILIEPGVKSGIELHCKGPYRVPDGNDNLVYKAAALLMASTGRQDDVRITLPAGSGLGSGSSDAAATLIGLRRFLRLDADDKTLAVLAAQLGSDVPFFLSGPLAFCAGRGEKITRIELPFSLLTILFLPDISVSTKAVYENYSHDSELYERLHSQIEEHLRANKLDAITDMGVNMLAKSCYSFKPDLAELKEEIEALGRQSLCLSGSGSALFSIINEKKEDQAREFQRAVSMRTGCKSVIVRNIAW